MRSCAMRLINLESAIYLVHECVIDSKTLNPKNCECDHAVVLG